MNFNKMSGPELLSKFNSMITPKAKELGFNQVKKFADLKTAVRRCKALEAALGVKKEEEEDKGIAGEFNARKGSERGKVLAKLEEKMGNQIPLKNLGPQNAIEYLRKRIADHKLPYRIDREKNGKEISYGLYKD